MVFLARMAKINGQRVLIFLDFLRLLAHMIRPASQQHIKAFKNPNGLKKCKGIVSKVPVPLTDSPNGREGRGRGSHPICLIPNGDGFPRSQLSRLGKELY